jgi:alkanesulfonate monooxygenase SsuD/methylene tetrahydromethanopterin reductase-like flavin-dependent oxidoreductase (luciferase family)
MAAKINEPLTQEQMAALVARVEAKREKDECTVATACEACGITDSKYYYYKKVITALAEQDQEASAPAKPKGVRRAVQEAVAEANEEVAEYEAETVRVFVFEGSPEAVAEAIGRTFYGQ